MTARRFLLGSRVGPRGIAHESNTPSCSRRKSKCMRVARCFWTQKRLPWGSCSQAEGSDSVGSIGSPLGSGVCLKSRLRRYSSRAVSATLQGRSTGRYGPDADSVLHAPDASAAHRSERANWALRLVEWRYLG